MKPKYNNILIDAVMHLGDLIHATTLIPLLKQQYPDARISYLVKPELVDLFKNIDNIEYVIPYKYKSKGDYFSVFRMAKEIKKYNEDKDFKTELMAYGAIEEVKKTDMREYNKVDVTVTSIENLKIILSNEANVQCREGEEIHKNDVLANDRGNVIFQFFAEAL